MEDKDKDISSSAGILSLSIFLTSDPISYV